MRIFDALVYFRQQCPIGSNLDAFILAKAQQGVEGAQCLIDAEECFLPKDARELRHLQNPRFKLTLVSDDTTTTGIVTDGVTTWRTVSTKPEDLAAVYLADEGELA